MESKWWPRLQWFLILLFNFKKTSYPLSKWGTKIILASMLGGGLISINLTLEFKGGTDIPLTDLLLAPSTIFPSALALIALFIGGGMIRHELSDSARTIARVLITGLPGTSIDFPSGLLTRTEERKAREPVELGTSDVSISDIDRQIKRFSAEQTVDIFKRFVLHKDCKNIYIGGLARVPFLVAYGSFLRNQTAKIHYFDKFHKESKWQLLNTENEKIEFSDTSVAVEANNKGQIGLAIAFSTDIIPENLPEELQNNTLILHPNTKSDRNLIKNQENLETLGSDLKRIIDGLSQSSAKEIHLFLSVQSAFALEIGRQFQEGTHRPWVIHNFNGVEGKYEWALKLTKNGIEEYSPKTQKPAI